MAAAGELSPTGGLLGPFREAAAAMIKMLTAEPALKPLLTQPLPNEEGRWSDTKQMLLECLKVRAQTSRSSHL